MTNHLLTKPLPLFTIEVKNVENINTAPRIVDILQHSKEHTPQIVIPIDFVDSHSSTGITGLGCFVRW